MRLQMFDAQQALGFLVSQTSSIEAEVYRTQYPDIQYPSLIPVDTSANEWAKSVTYFSMDKVGQADWFHARANDMRLADVNRTKYETGISMAGIGYRYDMEELGQAMMVPGTNLTSERAEAARRAYEEFVENIAFVGDASKGFVGITNNPLVTRVDAANNGTGPSRLWSTKTADNIAKDVNDALTGIYTGSLTVEMADTILLPITAMALIASKPRSDLATETLLSWLQKYNVYTLQTGQPLTIRGVLGLEAAGTGGTGRMVVYRKDPRVIKMHIPMPHRFLPVWPTGPLVFDIPGIFRLGGVEIRRPGAVRYVDGITAAP